MQPGAQSEVLGAGMCVADAIRRQPTPYRRRGCRRSPPTSRRRGSREHRTAHAPAIRRRRPLLRRGGRSRLLRRAALLAGIEDLTAALNVLVEAAPDAIQLSPGSARLLQGDPGPTCALVLRTDVANVYGPTVDAEAGYFSELVPEAVEQAVRLDAACVVVNLLWIDGREDLHRACVRNVGALKARCEPAGMPLMVEPLAMKPGTAGYGVNGDPERIRALVRQAVELGADVIKADPTDDLGDYRA